MGENSTESAEDFCRWQHRYSVSDEGEHAGLFPAIDSTRDDGRKLHLHLFENGDGTLTLSLYGTAGVTVELAVDDESEAAFQLSS